VQQVLYRKPYATEWETLSFEQAMEMAAQRVKKARDENWQVAMPSRSPAEPGPDTFRCLLENCKEVLSFSVSPFRFRQKSRSCPPYFTILLLRLQF
jgi:hypothetical protein